MATIELLFDSLAADRSLSLPFDHANHPLLEARRIAARFDEYHIRRPGMIREWDRQYPGRIANMFTAMGNIVPSHMMDRNLYPFTTIQATGVADAGGDKAFDDDEDDSSCAPKPATVRWFGSKGDPTAED